MPRDEMVDIDVRNKCNHLYRQWATEYKNTPGLSQVASLYKQLPQTKRHQPKPSQSKVIRETEADVERENAAASARMPTSPIKPNSTASSSTMSSGWTPQSSSHLSNSSSSSFFKKDKKGKTKPFNLEKEKHDLLETIAEAQLASTNLINALKRINREHQRVSDNPECKNHFEACKLLRRRVLRYIQLVESEKFIGSLLTANDELVKALMSYEVMDKSIDDDSDSDAEYEFGKAAFQNRASIHRDAHEAFAAPARPPRPTGIDMPPAPAPAPDSESEPEEAEDENDPFADSNAVKTPHIEKSGLTW